MARRGRRAAREEEMRAVVEKWERSGMALSRFADGEGIARKTLYRWRKRLGIGGDDLRVERRGAGSSGESRSGLEDSALFTEVNTAVRTVSLSAVTYEVVFAGGTTVRVPEHFEPGSLRTLLETLGKC
jgi:transposase-like protein